MSLDKVDSTETNALIERWKELRPTAILDHGKNCCRVVREWLSAMDRSLLVNASLFCAPRWIRERYEWGPSRWPLYWCEIVELNTLDCGALAALTREVLADRGVIAFAVQLVQQFSEQDVHHWRERWMTAGQSVDWIAGTCVYHEACAVIVYENRIRIWDPTNNFWIYPGQSPGYEATLAARVIATVSDPSTLVWGNHQIALNRWMKIC
jgi:hypothetical protein